jgi:hypothetical protein
MKFKEWLISEDAADTGSASSFFYKLSLYPTDAYDGADAFLNSKDIWALQNRWRIEAEQGRKFHNIDREEYLDKKFTTVQSLTMPGNKKWKHSSSDRPNLEYSAGNMIAYGVKKTDASPPKISSPIPHYGLPLNNLFGDEVTELKSLPADFDKPWKKVYENITPYYDIGTTRAVNAQMGVASKYVGPDETGQKGQEDMEIADFGFDRPKTNPYLPRRNRKLRQKIRSYR